MLLGYLLLFLLHLSASTCHATSRNPHIFLNPGAAHVVPAPSPAIHDHLRSTAKDLFDDNHYPYAMMGWQGATPPVPSSPGGEGVRPPDDEINAAMAPSPSPSPLPSEVDNGSGGYGEGELGGGGGDVSGGGNGEGWSYDATGQEESVAVDYEEPKTHPPSHN